MNLSSACEVGASSPNGGGKDHDIFLGFSRMEGVPPPLENKVPNRPFSDKKVAPDDRLGKGFDIITGTVKSSIIFPQPKIKQQGGRFVVPWYL